MEHSVFSFPRVVLRHRDLLRSFVWRDLAARYEGSILGRLWPVLYPLLLLALYHMVFSVLLGLKFTEAENPLVGGGWSTTFYLLTGILPWIAFAECSSRCTSVVLENSNLIKKIAFPSELLPVFVVGAQTVHFLISLLFLVVLYLCVMLSGQAGPTFDQGLDLSRNLAFLPIPILLQLCFGLGVGMVLATLNVFARDVSQVVPVVLQLWMLITPIFYPLAQVQKVAEEKGREWILTALSINPMYHFMAMYRACFSCEPAPGEAWRVPAFPWGSCAVSAVLAVLVLALGHRIFVSCKGMFPDEV